MWFPAKSGRVEPMAFGFSRLATCLCDYVDLRAGFKRELSLLHVGRGRRKGTFVPFFAVFFIRELPLVIVLEVVYRVPQKKLLTESYWSHVAQAQSPVAGNPCVWKNVFWSFLKHYILPGIFFMLVPYFGSPCICVLKVWNFALVGISLIGDASVSYTYPKKYIFFIGPRSNHSLRLSVTN